MPGSEIFEAMMHLAASSAAFRGRWWEEMADAARSTRKAYGYGMHPRHHPYCDPYCDPYGDPYCDPYCDPCAPQQSYRSQESCDPCEGHDSVNIKEVKGYFAELKEHLIKEKKLHEDPKELAKFEAHVDEVLHAVKLARVSEAMRRQKWSRGKRSYRYPC